MGGAGEDWSGWLGWVVGCGLWVGAGHFHAVTAAILVWRICEIKKLLASFLPPPQPHNHRHRSQAVLPSIPASPIPIPIPSRSHQVICWSLAKCSW